MGVLEEIRYNGERKDDKTLICGGMDLNDVSDLLKDTLCEALGMQIVKAEPDSVVMTMPVNHATRQPFGLLHGGASVALAESVASIGSALNLNPQTHTAVGIEINANHLRSKRDGVVTATGTPLHRGQRTQVWEVRIVDEAGKLICISRCTIGVVYIQHV